MEHTVIVHGVRFRLVGTSPLLIPENYYDRGLCRGGPCPLHHLRAVSLKKVPVRAARLMAGMSTAYVRGGMFVVNLPVPILRNGEPYTDAPTVERATLNFHEYLPWEVAVCVHYNISSITEAQIIELYQLAGHGVGLSCPPPVVGDGLEGNFRVCDVVSLGELQRFGA